jgi:hypothetical protein
MKDAIIWDRPFYYVKGKRFIPKIGENTTVIAIDGRLNASLDWMRQREQAHVLIEQGQAILWEIDLGLFSQLTFPLTNQSQYLSLGLSLEHFQDTLWKDFQDYSIGLTVFRGSADFSLDLPWKEEFFGQALPIKEDTLFCCDVAAEYLSLLVARFSNTIPIYVNLDTAAVSSPLEQAILLHPERWEFLNLYLTNCQLPILSLGLEPTKATLAICLPPLERAKFGYFNELESIFESLIEEEIPFRIISETHLTIQWDGLDKLIYLPEHLSAQGQRKLNGFSAAGGEIISASQFNGK